jgi:coatomer protein complex subunit epsilon
MLCGGMFFLTHRNINADHSFSRLQSEYPEHPLVVSFAKRDAEFDELAAKFTIPPPAVAAAA